MALFFGSSAALFIGTGYIALDTGFSWTGHFDPSLSGDNRNIGLYVLYLLFPLVCLFLFYILEALLVIRVLGEKRPLSTYCLITCNFDALLTPCQSTLLALPYFSPLAKCSTLSSALTFVAQLMARSTVPSLRLSFLCYRWYVCGYSGAALPKTTGRPWLVATTNLNHLIPQQQSKRVERDIAFELDA